MILHRLPLDDWFDDIPEPDPLDDSPMVTNDRFDMYGSSDADDAFSMHEQAYTLATQYHTTIGGSENAQ